MNREIKFRAWDIQYKKMADVTMILFSTDELDHSANDGEPKSIEHFHLMQFTGLKDKNGVEIYEGDIVQVYNPYNGIAAHGYAKVVFSYEYVGGWVITTDGTNYLTIGTRPNYIEVVGNEYENPELLNA